jgi:hypothetical protein
MVEDYYQEWELGRVLVWDVGGMAGLGRLIGGMEYWCRIHSDVDESVYSLE